MRFIILFSIDARLTLIVFLFLPILVVFTLFFNKRIYIAYMRNRERIGDVNAQVEDTLSGIRVVKSFVNEETERKKFAVENDRFLESRKSTYRNDAYFYQGVGVITQMITVAVVVFGGIGITRSTLDLADLITFLLYIGNFIEPIQKLTHMTEQFQEGIASFNRFMEIVEIEPEIQDAPNAIELEKVKGNVEFRNVGFRYRDDHAHVLKNISLQVKAGEYVALVGSSGAGKTTLCSLIPRFYDVNEGQILVDGIDIRDIKLDSLRRNVGVVQQDVYLFAGTVFENIRYGKPDAS